MGIEGRTSLYDITGPITRDFGAAKDTYDEMKAAAAAA